MFLHNEAVALNVKHSKFTRISTIAPFVAPAAATPMDLAQRKRNPLLNFASLGRTIGGEPIVTNTTRRSRSGLGSTTEKSPISVICEKSASTPSSCYHKRNKIDGMRLPRRLSRRARLVRSYQTRPNVPSKCFLCSFRYRIDTSIILLLDTTRNSTKNSILY